MEFALQTLKVATWKCHLSKWKGRRGRKQPGVWRAEECTSHLCHSSRRGNEAACWCLSKRAASTPRVSCLGVLTGPRSTGKRSLATAMLSNRSSVPNRKTSMKAFKVQFIHPFHPSIDPSAFFFLTFQHLGANAGVGRNLTELERLLFSPLGA